MGDNSLSLQAFRQSVQLAPNDTLATLRYIRALWDNQLHSTAHDTLTQLLHTSPRDLDVLRFATMFTLQHGDTEAAVQHATHAVRQAELTSHAGIVVTIHTVSFEHQTRCVFF